MPGDRHIDISVHAHPALLDPAPDQSNPSLTNIFQSVIVPTVQPLFAQFDTHFHKKRRAPQALLDMRDVSGWEGASDVTLIAKLWAAGPAEIEVIGIELNVEVGHAPKRLSIPKCCADLSFVEISIDSTNAVFPRCLQATAGV